MKKFLKNHKAASVIEFALTFPVVIYLLFFIIEVWRLKNVQTAVDAIAEEFCINFMTTRCTTSSGYTSEDKSLLDFDSIINKYKPAYISKDDISYYFTLFSDANALYNNVENIAIYWPVSETSTASNIVLKTSTFSDTNALYNNVENGPVSETSTASNIASKTSANKQNKNNQIALNNYKKPELGKRGENADTSFLMNVAFIVTVVVKHKFSSSFVEKLFAGGANTSSGDTFLVWSRGVGFCR